MLHNALTSSLPVRHAVQLSPKVQAMQRCSDGDTGNYKGDVAVCIIWQIIPNANHHYLANYINLNSLSNLKGHCTSAPP